MRIKICVNLCHFLDFPQRFDAAGSKEGYCQCHNIMIIWVRLKNVWQGELQLAFYFPTSGSNNPGKIHKTKQSIKHSPSHTFADLLWKLYTYNWHQWNCTAKEKPPCNLSGMSLIVIPTNPLLTGGILLPVIKCWVEQESGPSQDWPQHWAVLGAVIRGLVWSLRDCWSVEIRQAGDQHLGEAAVAAVR